MKRGKQILISRLIIRTTRHQETLRWQIKEKTAELPKNTLKKTLMVSHSILRAGTVNLNKVKNSVPHVRGSGVASAHADYKLLTRYFDQGKIVSEEDCQRYEQLMRGLPRRYSLGAG